MLWAAKWGSQASKLDGSSVTSSPGCFSHCFVLIALWELEASSGGKRRPSGVDVDVSERHEPAEVLRRRSCYWCRKAWSWSISACLSGTNRSPPPGCGVSGPGRRAAQSYVLSFRINQGYQRGRCLSNCYKHLWLHLLRLFTGLQPLTLLTLCVALISGELIYSAS